MDDAACLEEKRGPTDPTPDDYFPFSQMSEKVREKCMSCPVRIQCLAFALVSERGNTANRFGVWGGLDAAERRRLQKQLDAIAEAKKKEKSNGSED